METTHNNELQQINFIFKEIRKNNFSILVGNENYGELSLHKQELFFYFRKKPTLQELTELIADLIEKYPGFKDLPINVQQRL